LAPQSSLFWLDGRRNEKLTMSSNDFWIARQNEAAGAADATARPMQAASETQG
jgi:hypothetical protein